jgi:hypothetical protein
LAGSRPKHDPPRIESGGWHILKIAIPLVLQGNITAGVVAAITKV